MRNTLSLAIIPVLMGSLLHGTCVAAQDAVTIPNSFVIGTLPPDSSSAHIDGATQTLRTQEKQKAVLGSLYTVVAPIFLGGDGNTSFIRFYNFELYTTTVTARVVGFPSALQYGSAVVAVPFGASPQYSIGEIMNIARVSLFPGDTGVSLYLSSPDNAVAYQHVIWSSVSRFFENMTLCNDSSLSDLNKVLVNVHTSRLSDYPSRIVLHNYSANPRNYDVFITDARTGALRGKVVVSTSANTSYLIPFSWFEQQAGYFPGPNEVHVNLLIGASEGSSAPYYGVVGHLVFNSFFQSYTNMTQSCSIEG
ncbi:MAG: hypothetical protein SFV81_09810 [Pirellulaceae bacterium]|nr:hypothetical protein [Pirellulaceae bacterium]